MEVENGLQHTRKQLSSSTRMNVSRIECKQPIKDLIQDSPNLAGQQQAQDITGVENGDQESREVSRESSVNVSGQKQFKLRFQKLKKSRKLEELRGYQILRMLSALP